MITNATETDFETKALQTREKITIPVYKFEDFIKPLWPIDSAVFNNELKSLLVKSGMVIFKGNSAYPGATRPSLRAIEIARELLENIKSKGISTSNEHALRLICLNSGH